ncbi:hypothetical protein AB0940_21860 [Streptomyces sp. NPDC006656]|uniref:hypothetical protein n=1 Tax=Streptomyces sp. NPDC006656 TaxID=3156899 RepID=UPI0034559758
MSTADTAVETADTTAGTAGPPARRPATAWPVESALFSAAMIAQRLPWADAPARALGLDLLTREGLTRGLLAHLRRTRSGRPVRLRTPFGTFLVPLSTADAEGLLARAEQAGALGPATGITEGGQRYGLSPHVAPVREPAAPDADLGPLVAEDVDRVIAVRRGDGTLEWHDWYEGMLRLSRRVVVGAAAADDTLLSRVLAAATAPPAGRSSEARAAALRRRLAPYLAAPDGAPGDGTAEDAAATTAAIPAAAHLLALVSEAATRSALQALALLAAGCATSPEEAVAEALHRYPPVAAAVYPVREPFVWQDMAVAPGTEVLCMPGRLRELEGGSRRGDAPSALCAAPSGCAATRFATRVAEEIVRRITAEARPVVIAPRLAADRLPDELDPRTLLVALGELTGHAGDGRVTVGMPTALPVLAYGHAPQSYGALAGASADRLERHAESLTACAGNSGWSKDEAGERFRMALLGHADQCARAAADVRRAAKRLTD